MINVAVIVGSARRGRTAATVAQWFVGQTAQFPDLDVSVIDLADVPLPGEPTDYTPPVLGSTSPLLARADAFVVVTPEYNHSFPASLKAFIDWHFTEWQAKPVGFVSYGGISGGLRAVEQLRLVFPEVHAVTIRDTVSFHRVWDLFDANGSPVQPDGCNGAAKTMLDQLSWWAVALREARLSRPYNGPQQQLYPQR